MMTRPAESSGRPLERHGNVSPREMAVEGAKNPGTEPGVQVGPFASNAEGPDDSRHRGLPSFGSLSLSKGPERPAGSLSLSKGPERPAGSLSLSKGQSPASEAAPMMPELLRWIAGTIGVFRSSRGRKSPAFFDTPPPTTNRSGLNRNSMWE